MLMIMIMNHDDAKESIAQTERKAACENNIFAAAAKFEGVTPFIIRYSFDFNLKIFLIICKYHLKKLLIDNYVLISPTHSSSSPQWRKLQIVHPNLVSSADHSINVMPTSLSLLPASKQTVFHFIHKILRFVLLRLPNNTVNGCLPVWSWSWCVVIDILDLISAQQRWVIGRPASDHEARIIKLWVIHVKRRRIVSILFFLGD